MAMGNDWWAISDKELTLNDESMMLDGGVVGVEFLIPDISGRYRKAAPMTPSCSAEATFLSYLQVSSSAMMAAIHWSECTVTALHPRIA